jgi:hypothetical protein
MVSIMARSLQPLLVFLVFVAGLLYLLGILWAGIASIMTDGVPSIPEFVTQLVSGIGGVLGTHFGAIFGISQLQSPSERSLAWLKVHTRSSATTQESTTGLLDCLQIIAAYFYVLALLVGFILWGVDKFSVTSAELLKNIAASFLGVLVGVLAVALNVKR